ncbi:MAG: thiamine pyrophosphate-dependent enzyme [Thermodesulfobacteriota bacterium]
MKQNADSSLRELLLGNEALARGALEAGISLAAGYPGTPSSEIIGKLIESAEPGSLYVEWSSNEKVALEVAAAASFAGLRSLAVMKQVGVNVAADFLLHLSTYGTRGGLVLISCEDPGALSSTNEGESRFYAKALEFPLLEPGSFQEAKDMTKWAFALSEEINNLVMIRSVTRLSHGSGVVSLGRLPRGRPKPVFHFQGAMDDPQTGPIINLPGVVQVSHERQLKNLRRAARTFNASSFNSYQGPDRPEILVITSSVCYLYCQEAIQRLQGQDRIGLLKLGTTWPLPEELLEKHLSRSDRILVVEETQPFLEDNIQALSARLAATTGAKTFFGKHDKLLPRVGELSPDLIIRGLAKILGLKTDFVPDWYKRKAEQAAALIPPRTLTFCPGCPHRASFWSIRKALDLNNKQGFVCGDIGCYSMAALPTGFSCLKTLHSMGSGIGLANGFGQLAPFGLDQPVVAVCGDSTFFHAVLPGLVNAIHNKARITLIVLDNSGTAMTGFQAHPGLSSNALGEPAPAVDIPSVCRAMGARVAVCDPFDLEDTQKTLLEMIENQEGVGIAVLKQICALSPERKTGNRTGYWIDPDLCLGVNCGCNRLCTRIFACPGLNWDQEAKKAIIDRSVCSGCGVCAFICPAGAIRAEESSGQ